MTSLLETSVNYCIHKETKKHKLMCASSISGTGTLQLKYTKIKRQGVKHEHNVYTVEINYKHSKKKRTPLTRKGCILAVNMQDFWRV